LIVKGQNEMRLALVLGLLGVLLVGCGGPEPTSVPEAPAATSAPTEVADVPTEPPPTDEPTAAPSTATSQPTSPPPTATEEPPAATAQPATPTPEPPTPTSAPPAPTTEPPTKAPPANLEISTAAFEPDGPIPEVYSCLGDNVSPDLTWSGVPAGAKSLLLLVYDLDAGFESGATAPIGFAHWIVFNIPPGSIGYAEGMPAGEVLADGALQGTNDFAPFQEPGSTFPGGASVKVVGYDGPCPGAKHRYRFALYALDTMLDLPAGVTMSQVLEAMEGHVVAEAGVVGAFTPAQ
jgi:Raf kinase inhibitor-like YbhB/YbcL family protein